MDEFVISYQGQPFLLGSWTSTFFVFSKNGQSQSNLAAENQLRRSPIPSVDQSNLSLPFLFTSVYSIRQNVYSDGTRYEGKFQINQFIFELCASSMWLLEHSWHSRMMIWGSSRRANSEEEGGRPLWSTSICCCLWTCNSRESDI